MDTLRDVVLGYDQRWSHWSLLGLVGVIGLGWWGRCVLQYVRDGRAARLVWTPVSAVAVRRGDLWAGAGSVLAVALAAQEADLEDEEPEWGEARHRADGAVFPARATWQRILCEIARVLAGTVGRPRR
jgi:hypothetical protein